MARKAIKISLKYSVEVRDKNGHLLSKETKKSNSWISAFAKWLRQWFTIMAPNTLASSWSALDTGNISRTFPMASIAYQSEAGQFGGGAGVDTVGMVVGTSDIAVDTNQYALQAKIAHGTASGQLSHGAQSIEALSIVGQVCSFRNTRVFTNNSGGVITVKEIGLYIGERETASASIRYLMAIRDVLASPQSVPDGASLTVRYTVSVTA